MTFLKIFALVKVVDEFDLKILANLVNILNHDDTKVRALRASATRTRNLFTRVFSCFQTAKSLEKTSKTTTNNTKVWVISLCYAHECFVL